MKVIIENKDDTFAYNPNVKNKLTKYDQTKLTQKLNIDSAVVVRNKLINELVGDNHTFEPAIVPKLRTLNNLSYRNSLKSRAHSNPILSLWSLSATPPYNKFIKIISLVPFYNNNLNVNLSIDATGSIIKPIVPPETTNMKYKPKQKFLNIAVCETSESNVPVSQMISETHTMKDIENWLEKTFRKVSQRVNEVTSDDSAAIIGAAVKVFTKFKCTNEYLSYCFSVLEKQCEFDETQCFLRLDTSHFVKNLYGLNCFKFVDWRVKQFYIKYLVLLKNCTNYDEIKEITKDLISLSLNKYENSDFEDVKRRLRNIVKDRVFENNICFEDDVDLKSVECNEDKLPDTDENQHFSSVDWFTNHVRMQMTRYSLETQNSLDNNMYYLPEFQETFERLLKKLPLWSNAMLQYFPDSKLSATSSNIESYFKNVKTLLLDCPSKRNSNKNIMSTYLEI